MMMGTTIIRREIQIRTTKMIMDSTMTRTLQQQHIPLSNMHNKEETDTTMNREFSSEAI